MRKFTLRFVIAVMVFASLTCGLLAQNNNPNRPRKTLQNVSSEYVKDIMRRCRPATASELAKRQSELARQRPGEGSCSSRVLFAGFGVDRLHGCVEYVVYLTVCNDGTRFQSVEMYPAGDADCDR